MFFKYLNFHAETKFIKYFNFHAKNYIYQIFEFWRQKLQCLKYIIFRTKIGDFRTFVQIQFLLQYVIVLFFIFRLWMATTEWSFW